MQLTMFQVERYPHNGTVTSKAASRRQMKAPSKSDQDRERIFDFIANRGLVGASDEEIQAGTGIDQNSARPRRYELHKESRIKASGTRKNRNNLSVTVWVAL